MSKSDIRESKKLTRIDYLGTNALYRHIPYGRAAVCSAHLILDHIPILREFQMVVKINQTGFYLLLQRILNIVK